MRNPFRSSWADAEARQAAEVVEEFGHREGKNRPSPIKMMPYRKAPNRRSEPDPTRRGFTFEGMFDWQWENAQLGERDSEISLRAPWVFTARQQLPYMPLAGDRFELMTQGRVATFEVNDVRPDGVSGVIFILNQLGAQF